jgi:hypothetical protein
MRTVLIFGAGASKDAGAPLMSNFLDEAGGLHYSGKTLKPAAFEDVFEAESELQSVFAKSYLDLDSIEALFGAIEMGLLIEKFGQRSHEDLVRLRKSILTLIVETLESLVQFPVREGQIHAALTYESLVRAIADLRGDHDLSQSTEVSFITFTYDLALDYALTVSRLNFDYCLEGWPAPTITPYLKLHGSISWGRCPECKTVVAYRFEDFFRNKHLFLHDIRYFKFDLGTRISEKSHCGGKPLEGPPILIPPTWNKTGYHEYLTRVWQTASKVLGTAENIFIVGYSLPEADAFFRYLFALGAVGKTKIKRFWVFNPDEDHTVQPRFEAIIGPQIKNRYKFFREGFKVAIGHIANALKNG